MHYARHPHTTHNLDSTPVVLTEFQSSSSGSSGRMLLRGLQPALPHVWSEGSYFPIPALLLPRALALSQTLHAMAFFNDFMDAKLPGVCEEDS